jgi:LemA protein
MTYDSRIARMRDKGLISDDQADRLARAMAAPAADPGATPSVRRHIRPGWVVAVGLAAGACLLLLVAGSGPGGHAPQVAQDVSTAFNRSEEIGAMGNSMRGGLSAALFLGVPLLLILLWVIWIYNSLVSGEERVFEAWAQVEATYQRRTDLIPNVVEAVSDYMAYERETLGAVTGQRTGGGEAVEALRQAIDEISAAQEESARELGGISGAPLDDNALKRLEEAQAALGASMHRVLALSESYPALRASDQVLTLQAELEGTENRISVARMRFNEAASTFNAAIRRMPASLIASLGNFRRKAYFAADPGADRAPSVSVD